MNKLLNKTPSQERFFRKFLVIETKAAMNVRVLMMITAIVGLQMAQLGSMAYLFIATDAMRSAKGGLLNFILRFTVLEKALAWGAVIFFLGLLGARFFCTSFFFPTVAIMGIQVILSAFLLHMLGINRLVYLGYLSFGQGSKK